MQNIFRLTLIVALLISLAANLFMYQRFRNRRVYMTINGHNVTQQDIYDYLTNEKGENVKLELVMRYLIDEAAQKRKLAPSESEVNAQYADQVEKNWQFAQQAAMNPWKATYFKDQIRQNIETARLLTADVPVTEDQMKEEYAAHPADFDAPAKAHVFLAAILTDNSADNIRALMEKKVDPTVIQENYRADVRFLGSNTTKLDGKDVPNVFTFFQPLGTQQSKIVFDMKPNEVKVLPPAELANQGVKNLVVRMLDVQPGSKADLNNPQIKERLRLAVAGKRSTNAKQFLVKLWTDADFHSEDPNDKAQIGRMLTGN